MRESERKNRGERVIWRERRTTKKTHQWKKETERGNAVSVIP